MKQQLREEQLTSLFEAWIVVDKNQWTYEQLEQLYVWSHAREHCNVALSNPSFEFWLLLHFEDGKGAVTQSECSDRLRNHIENYSKHIYPNKFKPQNIEKAVQRAKSRYDSTRQDRSQHPGNSTVYKLVERILNCKNIH